MKNTWIEYMLDSAHKYDNMSDFDKNIISKIFLSKVYASFFIFESSKWEIHMDDVIKIILRWQFENWDNMISIDTSNLVQVLDNDYQDINIWEKSYLFPFIKIKYNKFKNNDYWFASNILSDFEGVFYKYLFLIELEWKIVLFTDISEDFLSNSFDLMKDNWYKKIELHSIIPKMIDLISEKFQSWEAEIRELGISFPLSMLGQHAEIKNKMKQWTNISTDKNFEKLISYGLLDSVKIESDFNVSFNSDNENDKYRLHWFLYSDDELNYTIINDLKKFICKIDESKKIIEWSNFAWLPIYVTSYKKIFTDSSKYPKFRLVHNKLDNIETNYDIKLKFKINEKNQEYDYTITWIYPQYFKERNLKEIKWALCYLKKNDNIKDKDIWELSEDSIKECLEWNSTMPCNEFLNNIRKWYAWMYKYIAEENCWNFDNKRHPDFCTQDLFLTAVSDDNNDYLINITNPKKDNTQKLGHKITVNIYKLSSFSFNYKDITRIIDKYNKWNFTYYLWLLERYLYLPKEKAHIRVNNELFTFLTEVCKETKTNNYYKLLHKSTSVNESKVKYYNSPSDKPYINNKIGLEDMWSLAFMKLLDNNWHKSFFWWRTMGWASRELADVISIYQRSKKEVDINLFHMKKDPFEQKTESIYSASFSNYTVVIGQVLEKIKSFLYQKKYEDILISLKQFFDDENKLWWNYEIYRAIKSSIIQNRMNKINFNIYFPIKEKDYFNYEKMNKNKKLWLVTNWKRLKVINDIFKSNIENVNNPNMNINLNLWIVICANWWRYIKDEIKNKIYIINDINVLLK